MRGGLERAAARRLGDGGKTGRRHTERIGDRLQPGSRAFFAEGEECIDACCAQALKCSSRRPEIGLRQNEPRVRTDLRQAITAASGQEDDVFETQIIEQPGKLVFHDIGNRPGDDEFRDLVAGAMQRLVAHECSEEVILPLGECRLDPAAGVAKYPRLRAKALVETFCGAVEVELDDFGRTGADQNQHADVGPAFQETGDLAVELVMHVDHAGEIALFHDRRRKARLREDHDAGSGLDQMGAGTRADHKEKGVLHLAMQPDDRRQPTENLVLTALADGGGRRGTSDKRLVHEALPDSEDRSASVTLASSLPA